MLGNVRLQRRGKGRRFDWYSPKKHTRSGRAYSGNVITDAAAGRRRSTLRGLRSGKMLEQCGARGYSIFNHAIWGALSFGNCDDLRRSRSCKVIDCPHNHDKFVFCKNFQSLQGEARNDRIALRPRPTTGGNRPRSSVCTSARARTLRLPSGRRAKFSPDYWHCLKQSRSGGKAQ